MTEPFQHLSGPVVGIRRAAAIAAKHELSPLLKRGGQKVICLLDVFPTAVESRISLEEGLKMTRHD